MKRTGKVVEIAGGKAVLEVGPEEACSKCCSCGSGKMTRMTVDVPGGMTIRPGDIVEIGIGTGPVLKAYSLVYGLPLAGFFLGTVSVYIITGSPLAGFAGGMAITVLSFFLAGGYMRKKGFFSEEIELRVAGK
ncbi:MAG: SoxR reducing system RseC family protein [Candidatus Omnitrophica bacterium]|nr:SoxR reducing system RseC family protein [Candidatus Omnitrophota bacterium]MDD5488314.1 SoxR reducing system RseC family protein [Candidatus Omnitrophota bacterium]